MVKIARVYYYDIGFNRKREYLYKGNYKGNFSFGLRISEIVRSTIKLRYFRYVR